MAIFTHIWRLPSVNFRPYLQTLLACICSPWPQCGWFNSVISEFSKGLPPLVLVPATEPRMKDEVSYRKGEREVVLQLEGGVECHSPLECRLSSHITSVTTKLKRWAERERDWPWRNAVRERRGGWRRRCPIVPSDGKRMGLTGRVCLHYGVWEAEGTSSFGPAGDDNMCVCVWQKKKAWEYPDKNTHLLGGYNEVWCCDLSSASSLPADRCELGEFAEGSSHTHLISLFSNATCSFCNLQQINRKDHTFPQQTISVFLS